MNLIFLKRGRRSPKIKLKKVKRVLGAKLFGALALEPMTRLCLQE
jgi:hypothetical protein